MDANLPTTSRVFAFAVSERTIEPIANCVAAMCGSSVMWHGSARLEIGQTRIHADRSISAGSLDPEPPFTTEFKEIFKRATGGISKASNAGTSL